MADHIEDVERAPMNRRNFVRLAAAAAGAVAGTAALNGTSFATGTGYKVSTPTICCFGSTPTSITIKFCAGATGAPAGFSLQWMKLSDFIANGYTWCAGSDPRLCKASFSGYASGSRYMLRSRQCVTVDVGSLLMDSGTSTTCDGPLECDTKYVFRAFANATSRLKRSDFSCKIRCCTLPCEPPPPPDGGCTFTQGYWKTHGPVPAGNNTNVWPVTSLTLGTVNYTDLQLQSILDAPVSGNGLIALAHQLIAAKLNIANGSDPTAIAATITAADALIGGLVIPPVGAGSLLPTDTSALNDALTSYNEGVTGPGHCAEDPPAPV